METTAFDFTEISTIDLAELCSQKFIDFFSTTDKEKKKAIKEHYNRAAEEYNTRVKRRDMLIITSATKYVVDKEDALIGQATVVINAGNRVIEKAVVHAEEKTVAKSTTKNKAPKVKEAGETLGGGSKIQQILTLHKQGLSNKEIIEMGFNKSTVNRQVGEFKKSQLQTS